jgi:hypothetical protein
MRNFGLAACVALGLLAACTSGTLDFDFRIDDLTDDGGDGYTRDSGIRILSDATPPGRTDGSSGRGDEGGSRDTSVDTFEDRGAFEDRGVPGDRSFPDDVVGVDGGRGDVAGVDVARVDVAVDATSLGDAEGADGRVGTTDAAANRDARSDGATRDIRVEADAASSVDALGENDAAHADAVDDPRDTDAIDDHFDDCNGCAAPAPHLLITEIVTRPAGAEMIEIFNPTSVAVGLADYALSDSHLYFEVTTGAFPTASGSDFAARFPDGATLEPGRYAVVALGNASGGSQSFAAMYGKPPDFELRPTANLATDDPAVPNMVTMGSGSIGASASLTDGGEPRAHRIRWWTKRGSSAEDPRTSPTPRPPHSAPQLRQVKRDRFSAVLTASHAR